MDTQLRDRALLSSERVWKLRVTPTTKGNGIGLK